MGQGMKGVGGLREGGGERKEERMPAFQQALHHFPALASFLHFHSDDQIY